MYPETKRSTMVLGATTAAAAHEKVYKKSGEPIVVEVKPVPLASGDAEDEIAPLQEGNEPPPDGGLRAWMVVFGAFCSSFTTFGYINAWGVFQAFYEQNILRNEPGSTIAWIGSVQYSLLFLPGLIVGRLFDLGYFRVNLIWASLLLVLSIILVPECKVYWHFVLCQGFATGIAAGTIFGPCIAIVTQWFNKRRGLALGLFTTGSAAGGTVIPITVRTLLPRIGFPWTMRVLGLIVAVVQLMAILTLKRRTPPGQTSSGGFLSFGCFKSAPYSVYCLSTFTVFLGFYTLLTYVTTTATSLGLPENISFYFVAISNASSGLGRIFAGLVADRYGALNVMIPLTAICGFMTYAWPFAKTEGQLIAICIIYGFCTGSYAALIPGPVIPMGDLKQVGHRIGIMLTLLAFGGLLGPPVSGRVYSVYGLKPMGFFAGSMILFGVTLMCVARVLLSRKK
ncbi:hypothetical protein E1B28_013516 [Marasmius oreades]|uniref:Major facilitator superfamily (MFS) profile domain-containing protein n=1 Tax=Marasmius oreades TaxID=181124 RepID=A0A9P7RQT1_9AGAR|nr:uncharacterized protein E1B28_013516 [Marasmius oreades]KAG7087561.1 hypothetical protein E1B28_013516 [Marasmius oreades]